MRQLHAVTRVNDGGTLRIVFIGSANPQSFQMHDRIQVSYPV